jgi:hypothetical protein
MRIHFERSGGFTGMRLEAAIDTQVLSPDEAENLHLLIEEAGFFDLPPELSAPVPGADQFQYRLTVETAEREHSIAISDGAVPDTLQPLIRRLTILSRSARASS